MRGIWAPTVIALFACACATKLPAHAGGAHGSASFESRRIGTAWLFGHEIDPEIVSRLTVVWSDPEEAMRSAILEQLRAKSMFDWDLELVRTHAEDIRRAASDVVVDTTGLEWSARDLRCAIEQGDALEIVERRFAFERALDETCASATKAMEDAAFESIDGPVLVLTASIDYMTSEIASASAETIAKPAGVAPSVLIPAAEVATRDVLRRTLLDAIRDVVAPIAEGIVRERRMEWAKLARAK